MSWVLHRPNGPSPDPPLSPPSNNHHCQFVTKHLQIPPAIPNPKGPSQPESRIKIRANYPHQETPVIPTLQSNANHPENQYKPSTPIKKLVWMVQTNSQDQSTPIQKQGDHPSADGAPRAQWTKAPRTRDHQLSPMETETRATTEKR